MKQTFGNNTDSVMNEIVVNIETHSFRPTYK